MVAPSAGYTANLGIRSPIINIPGFGEYQQAIDIREEVSVSTSTTVDPHDGDQGAHGKRDDKKKSSKFTWWAVGAAAVVLYLLSQ